MNRAVFLDRDGVIIEDCGYVYRKEDAHFVSGIFEFLAEAQKKGYDLFIVTNQAGIARGYYTEKEYHRFNEWLFNEIADRGIQIKKSYYCPFHPIEGKGRYLQDSYDRKPNPGMILKAKEEYAINLSASVLIGDKDSDMEAGRRAGIGCLIFLKGKYCQSNSIDVLTVEKLLDAVRLL